MMRNRTATTNEKPTKKRKTGIRNFENGKLPRSEKIYSCSVCFGNSRLQAKNTEQTIKIKLNAKRWRTKLRQVSKTFYNR